jgi:hypothetical protein
MYMNQEHKKSLFWGVIGLSALVVALSFWNYAGSYADSIQPSSFRSFMVTGEGKVTAVPDVAQVSFSVLSEGGKDLGSLQTKNTEKMNTAIEFLKEQGIDEKDIKTQQYNISPRYQYYSCPTQTYSAQPCPPADIVGYTINQNVEVKIRDFAKIGEVLGGLVENGANTVSQLAFTIDDPTAVEMEARAEAIEKAKAKAYQVADFGGFSVGRLLSVDESNYYPRPMMYKEVLGMGGAEMDAASAPSIQPGSQEVTVSVMLRYEIK